MKREFMKTAIYIACVLLAVTATEGCSKKKSDELIVSAESKYDGITVDNVSYTNFVKGFVETKCKSCHGGASPTARKWIYSDYSSVKDHLARINNVVMIKKTMPKGGSISEKERMLLDAWIKKDGPEK